MWEGICRLATRHPLHISKMGKKKSNLTSPVTNPVALPCANSPILASNKSDDTVLIRICVKPGAKVSAVTGVSDHCVNVSIGAPPVQGEANTQLIKFLAQVLGVKKSCVELETGSRSREKLVSVSGISVSEACSLVRGASC